MVFGDTCNTGLSLGIGSLNTSNNHLQFNHQPKKESVFLKSDHSFTALSLGLSPEVTCQASIKIDASKLQGDLNDFYRQDSFISAVSSFSNCSVKREREISGDNEVEDQKASSKMMMTDDQDDEGSARKKLRLTKEQSVILENSFREHSTLNPRQKQALAKQLNLRPRQIEVWFQNRRARTKLKQTEVDCELLKKCCETLTEENRRLQKELQELKALKLTAPLYMQMPAATLTMCPSCERITAAGQNTINKTPFLISTKPSHLYSPLSHPSAAPC